MIKYYYNMIQGTEEWHAARCGLLTASEMKLIITPAKLQYAQNDKEKAHLYQLLAQRITNYVEPIYQTFDMLRGKEDEADAKNLYHEKYSPITDCGFITNDKWGFTLGFSPDALVGEDGILECKSRMQKYQVETIIADKCPDEFMIQVQSGLLVSERKWTDFISYCGGMYMGTWRVYADPKIQAAIETAATIFHERIDALLKIYEDKIKNPDARFIPTERRVEQEITGSAA